MFSFLLQKQQEERLEELKRREDLERLRLPITTNSLFTHTSNPATAAITVEELKKLVRHWKLHEVRGFWKTHPGKEDLIKALLNHMDDQNDLYQFSGPGSRVPSRPSHSKPSSNSRDGQRNRDGAFKKKNGCVLKPYSGDIFGYFEKTDGIIYLSRFDQKKADAKTGGVFGNNKSKFNSFVDKSFFDKSAHPSGPDSDDSDVEDVHERDSKSANERRIAIAEQLYKYSTCVGIEKNMMAEGTMEALDDFSHMDDPRALNCAAAVLANLTANLSLLREILDAGVMAEVILPLHLKGGLLPDFGKNALALALYRFSSLDDRVMSLWGHTGDAMLSLLKADDEETRMLAVAALVNVTGAMIMQREPLRGGMMSIGGDERQRIVEQVMPYLKALVSSKHSYVRIGLARAFKNFSMYENARVTMVEAGVCDSIIKLCSHTKELPEYLIDVITTIANLTNVVDGRERMIQDGIISCIVTLGMKGDTDESKKLVACAMANLTGVSDSMIRHVVMNGAARCLVTLCAIIDRFDEVDTIDIRVAAGLANLTAHTSSVLKLVSSNVHTSLMLLAKDDGVPSLRESFDVADSDGVGEIDVNELGKCLRMAGIIVTDSQVRMLARKFDKDDSGVMEFSEYKALVRYQAEQGQVMTMRTRQVLVSIGLCNLLSDFNAHQDLVKSGIIASLKGLSDMNDPKVNVICAKAFSNFVANPKMRSKVMTEHVGVFEEWLDLIATRDLECCKVSGNAIVHLTHDSVFRTEDANIMIKMGIIKAVDTMIELKDSYLNFYCASILCNLVSDKSTHETLVKSGILSSLVKLTLESEEAETKIRCASALDRLSGSLTGEHVVTLITSLSLLLNNTSDSDVTHYISAAFFELSTRAECKLLLARDDAIHKLLISMMRGAPGDTQIHGAKALCNLTCDEGCAGLLLKTGHVSDFVVIAILRTNSSVIKEICAESLFNLLHHEQYREEMVEMGVVWALMKLSKLDSRETQNICANVLFNFSCYEHMMQKIMEHGVPRLLAIALVDDKEVEDPQTKQFCAGALCNLAFRPEAGGLFAKGGAIGFLKELMDVENDENEMYCATILYNLSHCEVEARLLLVHERAVPLLINLSRSEKPRTIVACLSSTYNLTLNLNARLDMVVDDIAPPIMICLEHTKELGLAELGIASLYHLSVGKTGHAKECCIHMVKGDHIVGFIVRMYLKFGELSHKVGKLSSRLLLNLALEVDNHVDMLAGGLLDICAMFLSSDEEEERVNAMKIMSFLGNSSAVLEALLNHPAFNEFAGLMFATGKESDLLIMSQIFLNLSLEHDCCKPLIKKEFFEKSLLAFHLKSEALNWNTVGIVKLLVDNADSKPSLLKTGCAGIMSRVAQATTDHVLKTLCGRILSSMSSRKNTVTYSEGSIVAVLSTLEAIDFDEEPTVIRAATIEVAEDEPEIVICTVPKIEYKVIEPTWSLFGVKGEKEVKKLQENSPLAVSTITPPKVFTLQTNGAFQSVEVPNNGKVILPDIQLVSDDEEDGEGLDGEGNKIGRTSVKKGEGRGGPEVNSESGEPREALEEGIEGGGGGDTAGGIFMEHQEDYEIKKSTFTFEPLGGGGGMAAFGDDDEEEEW